MQVLEAAKSELETKNKEVAVLKAKNSLDLLDFQLSVVGDTTEDWEEIKQSRA